MINNGEMQVKLYPNPANNSLFIELDRIPENPVEYTIYSIVGNEVAAGTLSRKKQEINISTLSSGVYYMSITDENQYKIVKKIVKH